MERRQAIMEITLLDLHWLLQLPADVDIKAARCDISALDPREDRHVRLLLMGDRMPVVQEGCELETITAQYKRVDAAEFVRFSHETAT